MTKTEHLQFLVLMIPTFLILVAAAMSMADLDLSAAETEAYAVSAAAPAMPAHLAWDDLPVE